MKEKLQVLHLEDDRIHAVLARELLLEDEIECNIELVATEAEFVAALDAGQIELILAEFTLPGFDGMRALTIVRERFPDLPFIFVTGTMGEEIAIDAMKRGATDYVLKNRLSRLAPAVERALRESRERAERKQSAEALRRSEEKYRSLVDNISLGITLISPDMEILSLNSQMQQWFPDIDASKKPLCHESFRNPPSKEICCHCPVIKTVQDGKVHEAITEQQTVDGTKYYNVTSCPLKDEDGKVTAVIEKVEDITERKQAEEELRYSNEMFRALIEASPLAIFLLNENGTVKNWNPAAERIFGWSEHEVRGRTLPSVPEDKLEEFAIICKQILQGQPIIRKELQRQRKDGKLIDISIHAAPVYDAQGKASSILALATDISERKRLDRELLQSERKFRTAFEDAAVGMCLTGIDLRFMVVNRSLCKLLGYTAEELSNMNWLDLAHPDDRPKCRTWSDEISVGEGHGSSMEQRYLHRDGRIVWALVNKVLLRDDSGAPLYFINQVQDITKLKNLENQLRHAQKMEAIGTLAGGVAHDFNNILTAIIGYGSLLNMKLDKKDPLRQFVVSILAAADRAAGLTKSLLTFGRKQAMEPCVTDLNSVVLGVESLLLRLLREDIDLRTTIAESPCMVLADAGQIEQVLMNLATNARDAMQNGGYVTVATSMIKLDREFVATHGYGAPGSYAMLTVTDTGSGMDAETRGRIFEPFFTTKEVGQGTGLGLSMAYGIIKQHNGFVTCYSKPEQGTTFRIYLPGVNTLAESD